MIEFIDKNDNFFLNLSMPAGKALLQPAEGVPGSTIVTVMAEIRQSRVPDIGLMTDPGREDWFEQ